EVVRLYPHVQEPADNVHHVVRVDGRKDQVAGKRGLNGDLCGLGITNFADHDLVRVVTQNGAQAAGKSQSLLFIDGNLGHTANLIFDRIFNGDDLVFVGLDFIYRSVQRGGLATASGAGDQHHAVWLADVAAELAQVLF